MSALVIVDLIAFITLVLAWVVMPSTRTIARGTSTPHVPSKERSPSGTRTLDLQAGQPSR